MALKKSELYSSLWASCDALRGGMDASQYKDYVLSLLFIKYVSDKYAGQPFAPIKIPKGASFADMVAMKGQKDIGDQINKKVVAPLAKENQQLSQADFPDFNDPVKLGDGQERVERLTNLISIFENPSLDFSKNRADGDDILGDAYEYLMRHFATESGKSKGQFYTPAEVSRVMAKILGIGEAKVTASTTVYDPTCGSGSLLLKVAEEAPAKVAVYGQEKDATTSGLARMNMVLHDYAGRAEIAQGNTITTPKFLDSSSLKTFDYVVANPPFSDKSWSTGLSPENDPYERFAGFGIPPDKQGDYAYLLHIVRSLKSTGTGACILPHGVLFRGNAEAEIRRNLVRKGYLKGIIGLPANLFYGTGIPACIVVIDKREAAGRKSVFMIDASKGFLKDGNKNRLRAQDIHKIVDVFNRQEELPRFSKIVSFAEIEKNEYNLNLPRYIDTTEAEDLQDIDAHLRGGIPNRDLDSLQAYWDVIPGVRAALFKKADRAGYSQLRLPIAEVKAAILGHAEFAAFNDSVHKLFAKWKNGAAQRLKEFGKNGHPKELIEELAEDLLAKLQNAPLIDPYDVYQHLMDYWNTSMQDDCYLIAADGWKQAAEPQQLAGDKAKKVQPDFVMNKKKYAAELLPPSLLIQRWYTDLQAAVEAQEAAVAAATQQLEELVEEHGGEDGLLAEALNDKGKLTKASATARLKEIRDDAEAKDEAKLLKQYLELVEQESAASDQLKEAQEALTEAFFGRYPKLSEDDIKSLVVDDKWLAAVGSALQGELDRVSQTLTSRIRQLAERYATPLPTLIDEVEALVAKVEGHLKKMVAVWK
jgi:type I restriction enzyme M protein